MISRLFRNNKLTLLVGIVAVVLLLAQSTDAGGWFKGVSQNFNSAQRMLRKSTACPVCITVASMLKKYGKDIFSKEAKPTEEICERTGSFSDVCAKILVDIRKNHLNEDMNPKDTCKAIGMCLRLDENGKPIVDAPIAIKAAEPPKKPKPADDEDDDDEEDDDEEEEEGSKKGERGKKKGDEDEDDDDKEEASKKSNSTQQVQSAPSESTVNVGGSLIVNIAESLAPAQALAPIQAPISDTTALMTNANASAPYERPNSSATDQKVRAPISEKAKSAKDDADEDDDEFFF